MNWQPIETAPKDKPILVYCPEFCEIPEETYTWPKGTLLSIMIAHWHDPNYQTEDCGGWYAPFTEFYGGVSSDPSCEFSSVELFPTHWMFLPGEPK